MNLALAWPAIVGDAAWIVALSLIANACVSASRMMPRNTRLPLPWGLGRLGFNFARDGALMMAVALPFALGAVLLIARQMPQLADLSLLMALIRVFVAGLVAWLNVVWLKGVLRGRGG